MSYKALYRTYRPQTFKDVTGQEVVVKTLQNAINNNKISHAYLFCGPRGTGKTSIARIFAKALNCSNLQLNEPCDECISCKEISQGINPDVIEIDAASNNGVDEIRDIRDKIKYLPSGSKYKIYIIDEVHMLSGGAFNALLKTLEEPPKHAIFILATTEPQKLPATIVSRCQRYEFKALGIEEINARLKQICEIENVNITEEALNSISESAEGAMRDALSILDQAISYGNKNIDIEDINGVTGTLSFDKVISLGNAIENKDIHNTLETIHELLSNGKEISKIINGLLVFYRDVLLYKSVGETGYSKYIFGKDQFKEFCNNISISKIMYFIDVLCDIQSKVKLSTTPNIFLEIALIKMCNISVEDLDVMKRLSELENKINNIGNIEINTNNISVDNEKVNMLETRVSQIIGELNRLELRKQIERIDELKTAINNMNVQSSSINEREIQNELQSLKDKVDELDLFVNKEEASSNEELLDKLTELENKINSNVSQNNNVDLSGVYNKLKQLEEKTYVSQESNEDYNPKFEEIDEEIVALKDEIYQIKDMLVNNENEDFDKKEEISDLTEISEKIMFLEKRMYQIVAGELSTKKITKKDTKKNSGQVMLFGEEVLSISDFEEVNKEKVDFEELQKTEEDIEEEKVIEEYSSFETNTEEEILSTEEVVEQEELVDEVEEEKVTEEIEEEPEEVIEETIVEKVEETKPTLFDAPTSSFEKQTSVNKDQKVVSQYFDINKGMEVINKEHSSLVIKEKPVSNDYKLEKNLITNEFEKPVSTKPEVFVEEGKDKFASYNIKYIEQILHDSRSIEARNDKVRIEQVWKNMTRGARPQDLSIIETLQTGKVAVVGNKEFVIVFANVGLCNIVMRGKFKDCAIRILYNLLGDTYNYIALPIDVWTSKSVEYKQQYQIGIKFPTLSPINIPGLEIVQEEYETESQRAINKTLRMFGEDNVKIE